MTASVLGHNEGVIENRLRRATPPLSWRWPIVVVLLVLTAAALILIAVLSLPGPDAQPVDVSAFGPAGAACFWPFTHISW